MRLNIEIKGVKPLVVHNIRLANPHDEIVQQIRDITGKPAKQKTEQDQFDIERLEWFGGLYYSEEAGYHLETYGVVRCFEEAAKATRQGRDLKRALTYEQTEVPIDFPHAKLRPSELWERPEYRFWKTVGLRGKRVSRMRPIFPAWALHFELDLDPSLLDLRTLRDIIERAGRVEGLYEARKLGYGRFTASITEVNGNGKSK